MKTTCEDIQETIEYYTSLLENIERTVKGINELQRLIINTPLATIDMRLDAQEVVSKMTQPLKSIQESLSKIAQPAREVQEALEKITQPTKDALEKITQPTKAVQKI